MARRSFVLDVIRPYINIWPKSYSYGKYHLKRGFITDDVIYIVLGKDKT